jgi:hypothetical protein
MKKDRWVIKFDHIPLKGIRAAAPLTSSESLAICIELTEDDVNIMQSHSLSFKFYDCDITDDSAKKLLEKWVDVYCPPKTNAEIITIQRDSKITKHWTLFGVIGEEVKSEVEDSNVQKVTSTIHYDYIIENKND